MVPESIFCTAALMMNLFTPPARSSAREAVGLAEARPGAFRTERLSKRQLRLWDAIRRVAIARDAQGRPMHPTLDGLWRAVEQSEHLVFIELITDKEGASNVAGETVVEKFDTAGRMQSIRLRLFIPVIDRAYPGEQASREGLEFIPFAGLRREKRYAKVLGHELAHIEKAIRDSNYRHLLREICSQQSDIDAGVGADGRRFSKVALKERVERLWPLVLEAEKPALEAEAQIRRELLGSKTIRLGREVIYRAR